MKLRLLYHGHCFDGVASAATFTRFYKERIHPGAEVYYQGLLHRPGNLFDERWLIESPSHQALLSRFHRHAFGPRADQRSGRAHHHKSRSDCGRRHVGNRYRTRFEVLKNLFHCI